MARALALNPNFDPTLWNLIAGNAHLGRMAVAHRFLAELRQIRPGITLARIRAGQPAKDPARESQPTRGCVWPASRRGEALSRVSSGFGTFNPLLKDAKRPEGAGFST